ncbi:MFS transporter [Streptomyces sp. NBC_01239]|uniref:MFS transporter n=1 Tax=Streptomyces sp. NBC_01239 TaxID=2903792 RepID=UPI002258E91D|nr:MFS transporter [Streptomyces sp. NBC_01239]MCX4817833.1 MFS transporter [Streptomyces sp. NBC_01239]
MFLHLRTRASGALSDLSAAPALPSGTDSGKRVPLLVSRSAWARPAAAVFVVGWGANMFASLLHAYPHLSRTRADGLFGAYALGLVPALLIAARVSDRVGRRRALLAALLLSALGSAMLLLSGGAFGTVLIGRILIGVSAGAAFGPGTAWIKELSDTAQTPGVGARRAAVALTAGFAAGPLFSGAVVQWLPSPEITSYLVHIALVASALPLVFRTPETARRQIGPDTRRTAAGRRSGGYLTSRQFLAAVLPTAPWVFGAATVSFTALPALVSLGDFGAVGSGIVAATTLATGIVVQPWAGRLARRSPAAPFRTGMTAAIVGMLLAALTAGTGSVILLFTAAVVLGSAYGILLVSGLRLVESLAPPQHATTAIAVFYSLAYAGFAFPVLVQALSSLWNPVPVLVAGAVLATAAMATTLIAWPRARRSPNGTPPGAPPTPAPRAAGSPDRPSEPSTP